MNSKNYAHLLCLVFGGHILLCNEQEFNQNQELADTVDQILTKAWAPAEPENILVRDFLLEGKGKEEFAEYIRLHAEEMADRYHASALRTLRSPSCAKRLRLYLRSDK